MIRPFDEFSRVLEVDACFVGGGGLCDEIGYYFYAFPTCFQVANMHIAELECLNILVCIPLMLDGLRGHSVKVNCDNLASVRALQTGKTRDKFMSCVIRDLWFIYALNDVHLVVFHKPGVDLVNPDLLSRGFKSKKDWLRLCKFRTITKLT